MLQQIALRADDETGPVLQPNGTLRAGRIGYIENALGDERSVAGGMQADMLRGHLPVFYATGWLREVDDPAHDGAHQLNMAMPPPHPSTRSLAPASCTDRRR